MRSTIPAPRPARQPARALVAAGIALVAFALAGCGKSQAEKDAEKAAAEARFDAAAQAEWDRENTVNHAAHADPPPAPSRPTPAVVAMARRFDQMSTTADGNRGPGDGAPSPRLSDSELRALYQKMIGNVMNNIPHSSSVRFYDAYINEKHDAICGMLDYEMNDADGRKVRSKRQRFIAFDNDALVDTDAPGVHETFERMAKPVDCSPGDLRTYPP